MSCLSSSLYDLTRKNVDFKWSRDHDNSFRAIKTALAHPAVLAFPHNKSELILSSNACTKGLAAMLSQVGEDGIERPIAYASRRVSEVEIRYSISELDLQPAYSGFLVSTILLLASQYCLGWTIDVWNT